MNLRLLSSALGHADVSVTADRYLHVADREVIEGYQRFRPTIVGSRGDREVARHCGNISIVGPLK
jgi:hypothetical protein